MVNAKNLKSFHQKTFIGTPDFDKPYQIKKPSILNRLKQEWSRLTKKEEIIWSDYDKATTCLCMNCDLCLFTREEPHFDEEETIYEKVLPIPSIITYFDTDTGKTRARYCP
eukprot:NODE_941_length_2990_cov_0.295745.p3 type:complete len:111 gc:universal NODE_941_length_2990_cov_0.295745:1710-1378(-)